jgi:AcrR family transcriptional regulator
MTQAKGAVPAGRRGTLNEQRWREVLNAAVEVFEENGYPSASLKDIAARVGMLKGSLYYYIDSKEDLLFDVMERSHRMGLALALEPPGQDSEDAVSRLEAFIRRWMQGVEDRRPDITIAESDLRFLSPERRGQIVAIRRRINQVVQEIIAAGIQEGVFDPELDQRLAAGTLFQMLNGSRLWRTPTPAVPLPALIDWYVRLFVRGFANPESLAGLGRHPGGST